MGVGVAGSARRVVGRVPQRVAWPLVLFVVVVVGPVVSVDTAQPASRYALTAALAERHTVDLGGYPLGVDRAVYRGRLRSDKAPGQPVLDVPVYLLGRVLGAESATHLRATGNLGLWWTTFWSAVAPFAALLALMYSVAVRVAPRHALAATLALGGGTMMLPHAVNLYGHVLAGALAFAAWRIVERPASTTAELVFAGLLAAGAVTVEYDALIILIVVAAYLLSRERGRIAWFACGAVPPFSFLAWYQWRAFGAPWHTPFNYYAGVLHGTTRGGYSLPGLHGLDDVVAGNRGLLVVSPVVLVAIGAAWWCARTQPHGTRTHAVVALAIVVPYLLLSAGWSGTSLLEEPGPRYVIPALPFLTVPLAAAWSRIPRLALTTAAWGALLMIPAAFTYILLGIGESPARGYPSAVLHAQFAPTLWSMAFGNAGVLLHLVSAVGAGWLLVGTERPPPAAP